VICHLVGRDEWVAAGYGAAGYRPASLDTEGFIHFSAPEQVAGTANRFYTGREDLLLVVVDPSKLTAELRWEPPAGSSPDPAPDSDPRSGSGHRDRRDGELFPHLYGPIDAGAVVAVHSFIPSRNGEFSTWPGG
jgi:uncharacterized protein (DUF952 family)